MYMVLDNNNNNNNKLFSEAVLGIFGPMPSLELYWQLKCLLVTYCAIVIVIVNVIQLCIE